MTEDVLIRRAQEGDVTTIARLAADMVGHVEAQALLQACGFRPAMLEMTRS